MKAKNGSLLGLVVLLVVLLAGQLYRVKPKAKIAGEFKTELKKLGAMALPAKDVPVAAIVVYKGKIVGRGYNTVLRDKNAGGHAEINALSDAFSFSDLAFNEYNRDSLVLYSTFEPCPMCKGAMQQYKIEQCFFEQEKPFWSSIKSSVKGWLFDAKKEQFNAPNLQESLFVKHPDYPKAKR